MAKRNLPKVNEEITEETVVETVEETAAPEPEAKDIFGVVANCTKLNVRKKPFADATVVKIIDKGTEVKIDTDKSTDDFYKIKEGFVMKKFITIK